ncbi:DUF4031 domain-containing protein [Methylomonas sp. AM2-LC]|uniref:DUF4031 domain-containing protein n=1 Tax=Methylomonas sp. AM2-LC TaxID=3153301 RepID=UPI003266143C
MAVYVDNVQVVWRGRQWCHLVADSTEELHEFAKKLGMKQIWFQRTASYPHYDITMEVRARALKLGAIEGNRIQVITCARKLKAELTKSKLILPEQLSLF